MELAIRAWLSVAYRRWSRKRLDVWDSRRGLIRRFAPGRTFLDFGGMWSVAGEVGFLAEAAGASRVMLADVMDPTEEFETKRRERESAIEYTHAELGTPATTEGLGAFDVVWCTGVLYHTPDPIGQLMHLRQLTREYLVLGSVIAPEVPGLPQACVFYPQLPEPARMPVARALGAPETRVGLGTPFDYSPVGWFANYWWGITPSALRAMLVTASFEVVEEYRVAPFMMDVVARPVNRRSC